VSVCRQRDALKRSSASVLKDANERWSESRERERAGKKRKEKRKKRKAY
jgi:hypothetical protein